MTPAALFLMLAISAPASAGQLSVTVTSDALGPSRRAQIDLMAADWVSYKSRAYRTSSVFIEGTVKDGYGRMDMTDLIKQVRTLMTRVEEAEYAATEMVKAEIRASKPPSPERLARENAMDRFFEVRALTVYANMLPRILDEAIKDKQGRNVGRNYAGPEWFMALTTEECAPASNWHLARAGYTSEQFHEFENRANDSLGYPRFKR